MVELFTEAVDGTEEVAVFMYFLKNSESSSITTSYLATFFWTGLGIDYK